MPSQDGLQDEVAAVYTKSRTLLVALLPEDLPRHPAIWLPTGSEYATTPITVEMLESVRNPLGWAAQALGFGLDRRKLHG